MTVRILASKAPRTMHTDPAPWITPDGERTADLTAAFEGIEDAPVLAPLYRPRDEYVPVTADPANPILVAFRENYDGSAFDTHEWLFQLARHWAEWASPRIGSFPLEYRDPSGPCSREDSEITGEDSAYWEIADVISDAIDEHIQDYIVHAVAVLDRLDDLLTANGRGV